MEILDKIIDAVFRIILLLCVTEIFIAFVKHVWGKSNDTYKHHRITLRNEDGDPLGIDINFKKENKNEMEKEKKT